jgi:CheY-like chemotaxis protein
MLVLIVDDKVLAQRTYEQVFRQRGYGICLARTALGSIEILRREPVDLVLLDYQLDTAMTGLDVARYVCRLNRQDGRDRRVFMVSGYSFDEIKARAEEDASVLADGLRFFEKGDSGGLLRAMADLSAEIAARQKPE